MKVTAFTRDVLRRRRQARDLLAAGYEEVTERGGKLWELHRGCRVNHIITDVVISAGGKTLFIKTEARSGVMVV